MSHKSSFSLLALISALIPGCSLSSTGDCDNEPTRGTQEGDMSLSELRALLGDNGTLEEDECEALCKQTLGYAQRVDAVHGCSLEDPLPTEGTAGAAGAAGAAGEERITLRCDMTTTYLCEGRRHANWALGARGLGRDAVGAWLARAASAEQGSVHSFLDLRSELIAFGAPHWLTERALAASVDEVRHARLMRALAGRQGATVVSVPMKEQAEPRSLFDFALENATEGCVFEAYAALVAAHQAAHARDPELRRTMREIARDEAKHGELAWHIHTWCSSCLSRDELRRVQRAMRRAFRELLLDCAREREDSLPLSVLGLPPRERAVQLARALALEALSVLRRRRASEMAARSFEQARRGTSIS